MTQKKLGIGELLSLIEEGTRAVEYGIAQGLDTYARSLRSVDKSPGSRIGLWFAALLFEASIRPHAKTILSDDDAVMLIKMARDAGKAMAEHAREDDEAPTADDVITRVRPEILDEIREQVERLAREANDGGGDE